MGLDIGQLSEVRRTILTDMKRRGQATIAELAARIGMTREAVRQHLSQLEHEGWVQRRSGRSHSRSGGRPTMHYSLTTAGEHLFPKFYDGLTLEVLDTVAGQLGPESLHAVLATMTEARIREWEPRLQGLSLGERVEALKTVYMEDDAYMEVDASDDALRLVERNCPFLNVAMNRPVLCSVTVSVLTRLLGYQVVREERFQNGDGRCVFRVRLDQPTAEDGPAFALEQS